MFFGMMSRDVVLPVWDGVTEKEVFEYSPSLVDRVACTGLSVRTKLFVGCAESF
jgi:hypothetical protein